MWANLAESYGLVVHRLATDWHHDVDPAAVDAALVNDRSIRAVALPYGDTSTGVANDVDGVPTDLTSERQDGGGLDLQHLEAGRDGERDVGPPADAWSMGVAGVAGWMVRERSNAQQSSAAIAGIGEVTVQLPRCEAGLVGGNPTQLDRFARIGAPGGARNALVREAPALAADHGESPHDALAGRGLVFTRSGPVRRAAAWP